MGCLNLQTMSILATTPPLIDPTSINPAITTTILVPSSSLSNYQNDPNWDTYESNIKIALTVWFVDWNNTILSTQSVEYGGDAVVPATNPSRPGYTFSNWNNTWLNIIVDTTIRAVYTPITYNITYDNLYDSVVSNPPTYTAEDETFTLSQPERLGYTFTGWTNDSITTPTLEVTITQGSYGELSFDANWEIINYTIEYGGTVSGTNPTSFTINTADFTLINPSKDYYDFVGWTCVCEDYPSFNITEPSTSATIEQGSYGSRVYTAHFTPISYTIHYEMNGGINNPSNPASYTFESEIITLTDPTFEGYHFLGWTGEGVTEPTKSITIPAGSNGDKYYTANWIQVFNVTFKDWDGNILDSQDIESGFAATAPADPKREGYTFAGWDTDFSAVTSNLEVTAQYDINQYTISFETNTDGAIIIDSIQQDYGTVVYAPTEPERLGYTFEGWYSDEQLTQAYTFTTMPAEDITLYAKWQLIEYTIGYYLDGGALEDGVTNPSSYYITSDTFTLNNPEKEGFIFQGWTGTGLSELTLNVTINKGSVGNREYTAVWISKECIVTFIYWDDLTGAMISETQPVTYGEDATPPSVSRIGYTLTGWDNSYENVLSNISLTAQYQINQYTITFNSNGGSNVADITKDYGINIYEFAPANPTMLGYDFVAWYSDQELTQAFAFTESSTMPAQDFTLYAKWQKSNYIISYVLNGGAVDNGNPTTYTIDSEFTLNNPWKTGWDFAGWSVNGGTEKFLTYTLHAGTTEPITFVANWTIKQFTVTFIDWDQKILNTQTVDYLANASLPQAPTREGYTFNGWNGNYTNVTANTTLIASYIIINYSINYNLNGGSAQNNPSSYNIETLTFSLNNPTREGYVFLGWTGTGLAEVTLNVSIASGSFGARSYEANWEIITFVVNFVDYDGTDLGISSQTIDYGSKVNLPSQPTKGDCSFVGWYIDADYNLLFDFDTEVKQNYTLFAKFEIELVSEYLEGISLTVGREFAALSEFKISKSSVRTGYTLTSWNYIKDEEEEIVTEETIFNYDSPIVLEAIFTPNIYTISFDINYENNVGQIPPQQVTYDSTFPELPTPTRTGFELLGWYYNGGKVDSGDTFDIANNIVLLAKWELIPVDFTWIYVGSGLIGGLIIAILIITFRRKRMAKNIALGNNRANTPYYYDQLNKRK
jgi:uncharacterized repeat protein (TIGR02543 family)